MARNAVAYEDDFYAWTIEQARLLRSGELSSIDAENVTEELASMGRSDRRELGDRLTVLLVHLLKWRTQVGFRSASWSSTIREQRHRIEDLLAESPSLQPIIALAFAECYQRARRAASAETGLDEAYFPASCPFTPDQARALSFLPEP